MNPVIALALRSIFALIQEAPGAQHDVDGQPTNFGKAMAALQHFENVALSIFGSWDQHAASVSVAVPPPAPPAAS